MEVVGHDALGYAVPQLLYCNGKPVRVRVHFLLDAVFINM
jgi:hypothetical protein